MESRSIIKNRLPVIFSLLVVYLMTLPGSGGTALAITECNRKAVQRDTTYYGVCDPDEFSNVGSFNIPGGLATPDETKSNVAIGKELAKAKGWDTSPQFDCLYELWTKESNWNHLADNPKSSAYGIPQFLTSLYVDSSDNQLFRKRSTGVVKYGSDWAKNPATQLRWGLDYIEDRYKTPCNALNMWRSRSPHWY